MGKNVLIIREGSLGDLILTISVFYNFKKNGYNVSVLGKGIYKELFENFGIVDRFLPVDSSEFLFLFENNNEKIKEFVENFDLILSYNDENEVISKNIKKNFKGDLIFHPLKKNIDVHITDYLLQPLKKK